MDLGRFHAGLLGAVLCLSLTVLGQEESFGEACLNHFTKGMPDFILDLDDSVKNGATFLSSAYARRGKECVRACCKTPGCNLALAEQSAEGEDLVRSCFLINCLYEKTFVCKFARKKGFLNYVQQEVYNTHVAEREHAEGDRPPIARAGKDVRVQPQRTVTLSGIESWDDQGIDGYDWQLITGDSSVVTERQGLDQLKVSNLLEGQYIFQLTVTDTAGQQSSTRVAIAVLTAEETEEHCHAPAKVGFCRGSFPRWYYNSSTQTCQEFTFGGCKPNKNNYLRAEECNLACQDVPAPSEPSGRRLSPVCDGHCLPSQFQCSDGCCINSAVECDGTPNCADQSDEASCEKYNKDFDELQKIDAPKGKVRCGDFPDTGPCRASFPRWYYDPDTENCYRFTYGGCPGNENNFLTMETCLTACDGFTSWDMFGRNVQEQILEGSSSSVEVAIAVLLGICILVVLAVLGYCILKKRKSSRRSRPTVNGSTISTTEDTEHLVYNRTTKPV